MKNIKNEWYKCCPNCEKEYQKGKLKAIEKIEKIIDLWYKNILIFGTIVKLHHNEVALWKICSDDDITILKEKLDEMKGEK